MIVIFWANYEFAWGGSYQCYYKEQSLNNIATDKDHLQPLRFQGQSFDVETSLHYNRFRYYDSDVGMFIQRDPIGLLGGVNVFQYADNPIQFIDPLGLKKLELYVLVAKEDGIYPVMKWGEDKPVGEISLKKGRFGNLVKPLCFIRMANKKDIL